MIHNIDAVNLSQLLFTEYPLVMEDSTLESDVLHPHPCPNLLLLQWRWTPNRIMSVYLRFDHFQAGERRVAFTEVGLPVFILDIVGCRAIKGGGHCLAVGVR